jgi:hypothetical protein
MYRLRQIDMDGTQHFTDARTVVITALMTAGETHVPDNIALMQNYPNPFNPVTTISYDNPSTARVSLRVYTVSGEEVAVLVDGTQSSGRYSVQFDTQRGGATIASGMYFYRLTIGGTVLSMKMMLVK